MALCDAAFSAAASVCVLHISLAILLLVSCPLALIFVPLWRLRSYIAKEQALVYVHRTHESSLREFVKAIRNTAGVVAKFKSAFLYMEEWEAKGDWCVCCVRVS